MAPPRYFQPTYLYNTTPADWQAYAGKNVVAIFGLGTQVVGSSGLRPAQIVRAADSNIRLLYYSDKMFTATVHAISGTPIEWYAHLASYNDETMWLHTGTPISSSNRVIIHGGTLAGGPAYNPANQTLRDEWIKNSLNVCQTGKELWPATADTLYTADFGIPLDGVMPDDAMDSLFDVYFNSGVDTNVGCVEYGPFNATNGVKFKADNKAWVQQIYTAHHAIGKFTIPNILLGYHANASEFPGLCDGFFDEDALIWQYDAGIFVKGRIDSVPTIRAIPNFIWLERAGDRLIQGSTGTPWDTVDPNRARRVSVAQMFMLMDPTESYKVAIEIPDGGYGSRLISDNVPWFNWYLSDLGTPTEPPQFTPILVGNIDQSWQWIRHFTNGFVALTARRNGVSFDLTYPIPLDKPYIDITTGTSVSGSVTLKNGDAFIGLASVQPPPTPTPPPPIVPILAIGTLLTLGAYTLAKGNFTSETVDTSAVAEASIVATVDSVNDIGITPTLTITPEYTVDGQIWFGAQNSPGYLKFTGKGSKLLRVFRPLGTQLRFKQVVTGLTPEFVVKYQLYAPPP